MTSLDRIGNKRDACIARRFKAVKMPGKFIGKKMRTYKKHDNDVQKWITKIIKEAKKRFPLEDPQMIEYFERNTA